MWMVESSIGFSFSSSIARIPNISSKLPIAPSKDAYWLSVKKIIVNSASIWNYKDKWVNFKLGKDNG